MIVYIILFIVAVLAFDYHYNRTNRRRILMDNLPGPPTLPVIGNLLLGLVPTDKIWEVICGNMDKYGSTCRFRILNHFMVSISDPDDVEILLTSNQQIQKGPAYNNVHPWLKTGLLTSHGEKWRQRRKILTPAFHFNILKKYLDITNENGEKFIKNLASQGADTVQSLIPLCSEYTLNIICESAMGVTLDKIPKEEAQKYKDAVCSIAKIITYRITRPYITDWVMKFLWRLNNLQKSTLSTLHSFTNKVIKERKEYHLRSENRFLKQIGDSNEETDELIYGGRKKRLAMLDLLLSSEMDNMIDMKGIREEVDTFLFEGHDTTAMAMTFTLLLLAENMDIQDKVRAEVTEILDKSQGKIGFSELQEFSYLERCIKESLRLYPSVSIISRYISEELQLKTCTIPAKTDLFIQYYHVHRHPKHWPDPDRFNPDRFLPEQIQGRHPFSYVPFSAGPRNCIGQKFALMELKSLIARTLYNFQVEPIDKICDMRLLSDLLLRPVNPVRVKFIKIRDCI